MEVFLVLIAFKEGWSVSIDSTQTWHVRSILFFVSRFCGITMFLQHGGAE